MADIKIYAKPPCLYRYRRLGEKTEQEITALIKGYIYCPTFSEMNDPMESSYRISSRFQANPNSEKSRIRVQAALGKVGIASMSEIHDHEPMWAHYADQFKGMCVQYSTNRLLKGLSKDIAITRMMYSEKEPVLLDDSSTSIDRARLCLSSKTVRWASEREWRIFKEERGEASYGDQKPITGILLGARISSQDEERVIDTCKMLNVPVAKMTIDAYKLKFNRIRS